MIPYIMLWGDSIRKGVVNSEALTSAPTQPNWGNKLSSSSLVNTFLPQNFQHLLHVFSTSAERMKGIRVSVCSEGGDCFLCGVAKGVAAGEWETVECPPEGLLGGRVQINHPTTNLQFCEIEIFGYG